MAKIEFPRPLRELLEDSDLQAPIRSFADRVGEILADNKLPFFPDYTDHGANHINALLKSEVELVPKAVWDDSKGDSQPRLLCDSDAAVIIGATLLHDIAMHLRPDGFRELVSKGSRFQPLPWFNESHEGHSVDRPWHDLWTDYLRQARRFSDRELTNILGAEPARDWKFQSLPDDPGEWDRNHHLIVGEFIRRHHARLAHEVAIYGFPGLPVGLGEHQFPAMGREVGSPLSRVAGLIGLTARSHGTSLRVYKSYLDSSPLYPSTPKPMGAAVIYAMALLRVADYLQIDRQRAPAVLLQLRNPQSPVSVQEWAKHRAVLHVGPGTDPRAKVVTVDKSITLPLYLQLRELISGLQAELDHSTAVLDEVYGTHTQLGLDRLGLAIRRVDSNLQKPAFRDSLLYVPEHTGFTADPNLLTLLVEPLYGNEPSVGVRELIQNAVDAVRELEAWCRTHGTSPESLDLPEQDGDVLLEFVKRENGTWFLRVRDRGIGMTSETIQNYFLRAGASFRRSTEWSEEFLDDEGKSRVMRAGRFGIGAFAVFLIGPTFKLTTRRAGRDTSCGYALQASEETELIEIRRVAGMPVGTTIEVEISTDSVQRLELELAEYDSADRKGPGKKVDWYCWGWPTVVKRVRRDAQTKLLNQQYHLPLSNSGAPLEWAVIHPEGYDAVYWTFGDAPELSCNGLQIAGPEVDSNDRLFTWSDDPQLNRPCVAVFDSAGNLPLTIQRYWLSEWTLPFIDELARDVTLSFIANVLVRGPTSHVDARKVHSGHPLQRLLPVSCTGSDPVKQGLTAFERGNLRWTVTPTEMVPADPWLYQLLRSDTCLVYGLMAVDRRFGALSDLVFSDQLLAPILPLGCATVPWVGCVDDDRAGPEHSAVMALILDQLAQSSVDVLGQFTSRAMCLSLLRSGSLWTRRRTPNGFGNSADRGTPFGRRTVGSASHGVGSGPRALVFRQVSP
jgi:molecular chaperone HtpG